MNSEPTIFVVDGDAAVRGSLAELAGSMQLPVQCYESGMSFLNSVRASSSGCLVIELSLSDMHGLELLDKLAAVDVHLPTIFLCANADVRGVVRAMKQGAVDVLEKPFVPNQLRDAIHHAIALDDTRRQQRTRRESVEQRIALLTEEERSVMDQIAAGKINKDIATALGVSLRTIQFRRSSLMSKLEIKTRAAMIELLMSK